MKLTPVRKITFSVSVACTAVALLAGFSGHFVIGSIFGTAAACNLLVGIAFRNY